MVYFIKMFTVVEFIVIKLPVISKCHDYTMVKLGIKLKWYLGHFLPQY